MNLRTLSKSIIRFSLIALVAMMLVTLAKPVSAAGPNNNSQAARFNAKPIAQGFLPAQSDGGPAIVTISGLTIGQQYTIHIQGTYQWTYGWWGDAQWSTYNHDPNCFCSYIPAVRFNEVELAAQNGQNSAMPNHKYIYTWVADSTQLQMYILDSSYWDNSGGLSYSIFGKPSQSSGNLISQGLLPAQSNGGPAVVTVSGLTVGRQYTIQIQGTYQWTYGWWGDAQWSTFGYGPDCFCTYARAVRFNEVELAAENGQTSADPNHEYTFRWTADSTQLQMYILDSGYWDNSGGLSYWMYED